MVKLKEVYSSGNRWNVREVSINPDHIVAIREDYNVRNSINENLSLNEGVSYSRIYLNSGPELLVAGSPEIIESKINNVKRLLKG